MRQVQRTQIVDCETPVSLFYKLRDLGASVFLDSPQPHARGERYAIVGFGDPPIASDSLENGLRRFRDAERRDRATARFGHVELPFVGGLMFVGGGTVPFVFTQVRTVAVYDNFKRLVTVSSVAEDGAKITTRICERLRSSSRSQLEPIVLAGNAPSSDASPDGGPVHVSGAYDGDPFQIFRTLRAVAARPFMAFFDAGTLSVAGSGTSELLTVRGRVVEARMPRDGTGAPQTAVQTAASALRAMLVEEPRLETEQREGLDGESIELGRASSELASGRTAADALTGIMRERAPDASPVVGFLGWNGNLNSAALETVVVVRDGRFAASDWSRRQHGDPLRQALALAG
jgi:hypothetical protein